MSNGTEHVISRVVNDDSSDVDAADDHVPVDADGVSTDEWEMIRSERDQYLDGWQRSQADFANYRTRAARDQATAHDQARVSVLRSMLPLFDALDRARQHDEGAGRLWAAALDALQREDVERIAPCPGDAFDPTVHDALSSTGSGGDVVIASVIRAGYRVGEQILRPADVEVTTADQPVHTAESATADGVTSGDDAEGN